MQKVEPSSAKVESVKRTDKPVKNSFLFKIFIKVQERQEAKRVFSTLFNERRIRIGSKNYSMRVYLSYLDDKLERYARAVFNSQILNKPPVKEKKNREEVKVSSRMSNVKLPIEELSGVS